MSEGPATGEAESVQSPFDQFTGRVFGSRVARIASWTVFALGLAFVLLRISFVLLSSFEGFVSERLGGHLNAEISGLQGNWHGFTPQVSLDRLESAFGSIQDIRIEIDVLRSLVGLELKLSALEVGDAQLRFPRDFELWDYLLNSPSNLGLISLVSDAQFLAIKARLGVEDDPAELHFSWIAHSEKLNRGELRVFRQDSNAEQGLLLGYDLDLGILLQEPQGAVWGAGAVHLPDSLKSLIGIAGHISSFHLNARIVNGEVFAGAALRANGLEFGDFRVDEAEVDMKGRGELAALHGEFPFARLSSDARALNFSGARFTLEDLNRFYFSLPDQRIEGLTGFVVDSATRDNAAARWSRRFAPEGLLASIGGGFADGEALVIAARVSEFSAQSFRGSPTLDSVAGEFAFSAGAARILVDSPSPTVGLPRLFDAPVALGPTSGEVWVKFMPNYVGMRGIDLRATLPGGGNAEVSLSYSAPVDPFERQISGAVKAGGVPALVSLQFLPKTLPEGMRNWVRSGVLDGVVEASELLLSGYVRQQPDFPTMQVEMNLEFQDVSLMHHPSWPLVNAMSGQVSLVDRTLQSHIRNAVMLGESFEDLVMSLPLNGAKLLLEDAGTVEADFLAQLVEGTPLGELVPARTPVDRALGSMDYDLKMGIPLAFELADLNLEIDLEFEEVSLVMVSSIAEHLSIEIGGLNGTLGYVFPDRAVSHELQGSLFSQPATFSFSTFESLEPGANRIQVVIESDLDSGTLVAILGAAELAQGRTTYRTLVEFNHAPDTPLWVRLDSDLEGMGLSLPAGLAKTPEESLPASVEFKLYSGLDSGAANLFLGDRFRGELGWRSSAPDDVDVRGLLSFGASEVESGVLREEPNRVILEGRIPRLSFQELRHVSAPSTGFQLPELYFSNMEIGLLDMGRVGVEELVLEGLWSSESARLKLVGEQAQGTWSVNSGQAIELDLERIHLQPTGDEDMDGVGDLLLDLDVKSLPQANVSLSSLKVGERDYGSWKFDLRHIDDGVRLANLEADSRGLQIRAPEGVFWHQLPSGAHTSRFVGELTSDDLASAMEQWEFAPSVEAERAQLIADLSWPGPPWKPKLEILEGEIDLTIRRGRFRDIDAPAGMKLLSLLDFNAFIRRLNFDFSDVFGDGVAFDEVRVKSQFADGSMHMLEPVKIDGNGSRFRIDGNINLETGALDNQMQVTLKLSRSLPWLGAYLALLGNPVTGLGTLAIERLFRDPLERLSTAYYDVSGTLDEPVFTLSQVEPPDPLPEEPNPEGRPDDEVPAGDEKPEEPQNDQARSEAEPQESSEQG